MNSVAEFFGTNMVMVFFVYGLAWFIVGLAIAMEARKSTELEFARVLWFLAAFGFLHSVVEWSDMLLLISPGASSISDSSFLRVFKVVLLGISTLFLVLFGAKLIIATTRRHLWLRYLPMTLFGLWVVSSLAVPHLQPLAPTELARSGALCAYCHSAAARAASPIGEWLPATAIAEVWARYLLYLPGLLLTTLGLLLQARVFREMNLPRIAQDCRWAAAAFGVNIFFAGLVVAPAPYFPASVLNYNTFLGAVGIPPQVFRAAMALIIAYFVVRVLHVFEIEFRTKLEMARQERLQAQIEALEQINRMRSEFISNVSHELRTPLNSIIGFSELLLDNAYGGLNDKQHRHVQNIHSSGRHLLHIVNDILDLSKVEAGKMELHVEEFSVKEVLEAAFQVARNLATGRRLAIELKTDGKQATIAADLRIFNQIMYNLLSNAIKFTPDGGSVSIEATSRDKSLEIAVADTGIGIKPEDQERIFREFEQVESSHSRHYEGTGLGLALTRRLIELHGGRILVESEPGRGSTFRFSLPLRCQSPVRTLS